jgi:hypothetical protein
MFPFPGPSNSRTAWTLKMARMWPETTYTDKGRSLIHLSGSQQWFKVLFFQISKWKEMVADDVALSVTDSTTLSYTACRDAETRYPNECRCSLPGHLWLAGSLCVGSESLTKYVKGSATSVTVPSPVSFNCLFISV